MTERADVIRNRTRILAAASEIFDERPDPSAVTIEDIARGAGVGRATVYRHYPSVGAVATALLDDHERQLQQQLLSGAPPLGPGAPPADRLSAFYQAMVEVLERHSALILGSETGQTRYNVGAYGFWRAHVITLIREAGDVANGELPLDVLADHLMAPLDPTLYRHHRQRGITRAVIAASFDVLAARTLGARP